MILTTKEEKCLTNKKPQTTYKIKYVSTYVRNWLFVVCGKKETCNINFIDSMCNAGIYSDGGYSTAIEVLKLFNEFAPNHKNKTFNLFLNDYDSNKIAIITKLCNEIQDKNLTNINIYTNQDDINDYLKKLVANQKFFVYPHSTILYVDPYDFRTVHIPTLRTFVAKFYCELIFNVFTSDFIRNKLDNEILKCLDKPNINIKTKEELVNHIITELKINKMKYHLCYEFRTQTNVALYQIMFLTPNAKGLDKLKDALWETFNGKFYHRNKQEEDTLKMQLTFLDENDDKKMLLSMHTKEAETLLFDKFKGQTIAYSILADYILSNTLLCSSHIIENLLKPLIEQKKIKKLNKVKIKNNYKQDFYDIIG
jgi:three-Cys-motif partner protein